MYQKQWRDIRNRSSVKEAGLIRLPRISVWCNEQSITILEQDNLLFMFTNLRFKLYAPAIDSDLFQCDIKKALAFVRDYIDVKFYIYIL